MEEHTHSEVYIVEKEISTIGFITCLILFSNIFMHSVLDKGNIYDNDTKLCKLSYK